MSGAGFHLDLHRCVGCAACVLACRIENERTHTAAWRRVLPLNLARRPGGPTYSLSVACHHCDDPPCLNGCPANAYEKRPDGIVMHHDDQCIGCRYCEMTCPFGTPQFDADRGVVSKCHLCAHRVDAGLEPACVAACPTGALRSWGIHEHNVRLKPDTTKDPGGERVDARAVAHEPADPTRRGVRISRTRQKLRRHQSRSRRALSPSAASSPGSSIRLAVSPTCASPSPRARAARRSIGASRRHLSDEPHG